MLKLCLPDLFKRSRTHTDRSRGKTNRPLRMERLEERALLSVTPLEYASIREMYSDFGLPETQSQVNIIEITANNLSVANLKAAIAQAGTTTKDDLIVLRTTNTNNTITYATAKDEISIDVNSTYYGKISIVSFGTKRLTIDANQMSRVLTCHGTENLGGLTITGGNSKKSTENNYYGGGIYNDGNLILMDCSVSENSAYDGGGIYNEGNLILMDCSVSKNTDSKSNGYAIVNYVSSTLTLTSCNIEGNSCGGIDYSCGATANITNSVIACNSGCGIYDCGESIIINCTIAGNAGGGISSSWIVQPDEGKPTLYNTIVSCNYGVDIEYGIQSESANNFIGIDSLFTVAPVFEENGQLLNADSYDLTLKSGSMAIDRGNNEKVSIVKDIIGNLRVVRSWETNPTVDIGAYEYQGTFVSTDETPSTIVTTATDVFDTRDGKVSLREAIYYAGTNSLGTTITFDSNVFRDQDKIILNGNVLYIDKSLKIDASNVKNGIILDANHRSRVLSIYGGTTDQPTELVNLTVTGGVFTSGAGLFNSASLILTNCNIIENSSSDSGGGIENIGDLTLISTSVSRNSCTNAGGGIFSYEGNMNLIGCTIDGNHTTRDSGGGIWSGGTSLTMINCTITGNSSRDFGCSGIYCYPSTTFVLYNSIISCNYDSNIDGSVPNGSNNLIGIDPHFTVAPVFDENGQLLNADSYDLTLKSGSMAIDRGNNEKVSITKDIIGNPRVVRSWETIPTVDIGAYEYQGTFVSTDEAPSTIVTTASDVFDTRDGKISLREAIYYAGTNSLGTTITFDSNIFREGGEIILNGAELRIDKKVIIDASNVKTGIILNANHLSRVLYVGGGTPGSPVELQNLVICGGKTILDGGGVLNCGNLLLNSCAITDNSSGLGGGGFYNEKNGVAILFNCGIFGNVATYTGGGVRNDGNLSLYNCIITGNSVTTAGGGIYNRDGSLTMNNCTISENSSISSSEGYYIGTGGGIENYEGTINLTNCSILGNVAASNGGGIYIDHGTIVLTNCTVSGNTSNKWGGGIYIYMNGLYGTATMNIYNTIIATNTGYGPDIYNSYDSTYPSIVNIVNAYNTLSSFTKWTTAQSCYEYNESTVLYTDVTNSDYSLCNNSMAIDSGNNAYAINPDDSKITEVDSVCWTKNVVVS